MSRAPTSGGRRYGGQTAQQRQATRRAKLLDAGLELFGTTGYGATTIEQLCAAAGLHPRYFYEQFEGREALLQAVYDRHVEGVLGDVLAAVQAAPPEPRPRLRAGLTAFVHGTLADERAARINYFEMVGVSPALERRRREVLRTYAELIAAQAVELRLGDAPAAIDSRLGAVALVGATDGLLIDWLAHEPRVQGEQIIATLIEIFAPAL